MTYTMEIKMWRLMVMILLGLDHSGSDNSGYNQVNKDGLVIQFVHTPHIESRMNIVIILV